MRRLFFLVLLAALVPLAVAAQTPPSGWVIAIGDLLAWYRGTPVQLEYSKLSPDTGSVFALATANYMPNSGRADINQRVTIFIHLLCNRDVAYCRMALTDLQLEFREPLPFGQTPPNPVLPTTPPVVPPAGPLPFGGNPNPGQ